MTWQKCLNREGNAKMYGFSSQACDNYDITISTKKTDFVHRPAPRKPYNEPTITVKKKRKKKSKLQFVGKITYLGSTLSRSLHIDDKVKMQHLTGYVEMSTIEVGQVGYTANSL